jgi:hypothetical protein
MRSDSLARPFDLVGMRADFAEWSANRKLTLNTH